MLNRVASADTSIDASVPPVAQGDRGAPQVLRLVAELCEALEAEGVRYCHWKSNEALDRSASGENDLDLLVSRADARRFEMVLRRMGFRDAVLPRWKELPGVFHSYALDEGSGRMVHIHAHYQLVIGDDMTKNYRVPIEEPYLASAVPAGSQGPFRVPAPELELAVFLLRMVIKHRTWDAILSFQGSLSSTERRELTYLLERVELEQVWSTMAGLMPSIPRELWERCLDAVRPGCSLWSRIATARRLQRALVPCSRRPRAVDTWLRMWRRARTVLRRKVLRRGPVGKRLGAGGALVAIVGGDGAGKSTAVGDLAAWLGEELSAEVVHLGKPRRSLSSVAVKAAMGVAARVGRSSAPAPSEIRTSLASGNGGSLSIAARARLVWALLTARDRYRTYRRARRAASNGAIVVCDRYPLPQLQLMDGPVTGGVGDPSPWSRWMAAVARLERRYYDRIAPPDILIVLRVEPEVAVQRKLGEERESLLRPRAEEVWNADWGRSSAVVVDAGRSKDEVRSAIRSVVWSRL